MQCPNCGNNNAPGAKFCQNCGYNFSTGKKKGPWLYILLVVGALVVLCGGFFAYKAVTNQTASAPTKQVASSKKETSSSKAKKKESSSEKESSTVVESSSEREKASSTSVEVAGNNAAANSESTSSATSLPDPLFVDGRTSIWENVTNPDDVMIITGVDTMQTAHVVHDSATTPTHYDNSYNIEENTGNSLLLRSTMGGFGGGIEVKGDHIVWQDHETIKEYSLKYIK